MNSNAKLNYDKYGWRPASITYYECRLPRFLFQIRGGKNPVKIAVARRPLLARLKRARIRGNEGSADSCLPSLLC